MIPLSAFFDLVQAELIAVLPRVLELRNAREQKSDGSYVTKGDLEIQQSLLKLIRSELSGASVVSEEIVPLAGSTPPDGMVLVIDPIDGTENFTSGLPEWGVSVAIYQAGQHAASLLACPEMGVWLRSGQIKRDRFSSRIRGLSSSLNREDLLAATEGYEYRVIGCCVYNMINVIRGSFMSFENPKGAYAWDILAGLNVALEHGLSVLVEGKRYAGEYLPPTRKYRFAIGPR